MNREEAIRFIEEKVATAFNRQLTRLCAIIGIANMLAVIGLYFVVLGKASETAKSTAENVAADTIKQHKEFIVTLDSLRDQFRKDSEAMKREYLENTKKMAATSAILEEFDKNLKVQQKIAYDKVAEIERNWLISAKKLSDLSTSIDTAEGTDAGKLVEVMKAFNQSPKLDELLKRLDIMSSNEIRLGDIYVCWDTMDMDKPKPNVRSKIFKFPKSFEEKPVFIPAITASGSGEAFAVYALDLKNNMVNISANEIKERNTNVPARLSYLAIGKIANASNSNHKKDPDASIGSD